MPPLSGPIHPARLLGCALLLLPVAALEADAAAQDPGWPQDRSDIPASPRVTFGRLDNGLRYAFLPNATPPGQVSLRLLVLAGSLDERDGELGYAHFVEHMAFRSTRSFPADEKVKFLQGLGVSFGPHINAETTFTHTLYRLDLPGNSPATIGSGLRIMRDFADGLAFDPSETDHERGVVLSEALARHTADHDRDVARFDFVFGGTDVPGRWPIGTEASIKGANRAGLRAFYDAWYRPERMVVVVTGDMDQATLAPMVRSTFASMAARSERRPEPNLGSIAAQGKLSARFFSDARNGIQVELGTIRIEPPPPDTEGSRLESLSLDMADEMLGRRLRHLANEPEKPIGAYRVGNEYPFGRFHSLAVVTVGDVGKWETVVATAEQELRRALDFGFDASELVAERESFRAGARERAQAVATAAPGALADSLVDSIEQSNVVTLPNERLPAVLENIDRLTPEECRAALRRAWAESPRYVFVTASAHLIKPSRGKIFAAYRASRAVAVAPAAVLKQVTFSYEDFGPSGTVVQRERVKDLDAWLIRFANGVRLNLKRTDFEHHFVRFNVRIGTGRLEEPANQPGLLFWAGAAAGLGGLRQYTDDELDRALSGVHLDIAMSAASDAFVISGTSSLDEFPVSLRRLTANLTDAAFRADADRRLSGFRNDTYLNLEHSAGGVLAEKIDPFLAGGDMRVGLPPSNSVPGYSMATLAAWLRPVFQSGPIEVALVGDFDVDQEIEEVAKTLGALPPRTAKPDLADGTRLSFPAPPQSRAYSYATSVKGRPTTLVFDWPVNTALSDSEKRDMELLALVLQDRLRVKIRVEKGETYATDARFTSDEVFAGYARLGCQLDVKSESALRLGNAVRALALDLGRQGVTEEELERAKAQSLADIRRWKGNNEYWVSRVLADAQEHPWRLDNARNVEREVASATPAKINALAGRFLTEGNLFQFSIRPVYFTGLTLIDRLK